MGVLLLISSLINKKDEDNYKQSIDRGSEVLVSIQKLLSYAMTVFPPNNGINCIFKDTYNKFGIEFPSIHERQSIKSQYLHSYDGTMRSITYDVNLIIKDSEAYDNDLKNVERQPIEYEFSNKPELAIDDEISDKNIIEQLVYLDYSQANENSKPES